MSEEKKTEPTATKEKKSLPAPVGWLVSGLIAGAAAFGGTRGAMKVAIAAPSHESHHEEMKPPGPTVALEPFLVQVADGHGKQHPMKMTVAVEYGSTAKEDAVKPFTPRIRDAVLAHVRTLTFEEVADGAKSDHLREELLKKARSVGANAAERVLITDLVTQ